MALYVLTERRAELNENSCKLRNVEFQIQTSISKEYKIQNTLMQS